MPCCNLWLSSRIAVFYFQCEISVARLIMSQMYSFGLFPSGNLGSWGGVIWGNSQSSYNESWFWLLDAVTYPSWRAVFARSLFFCWSCPLKFYLWSFRVQLSAWHPDKQIWISWLGKCSHETWDFFFTIIIAQWSIGLSDLLDEQVKKLFLITLLWKGWVKRKTAEKKTWSL